MRKFRKKTQILFMAKVSRKGSCASIRLFFSAAGSFEDGLEVAVDVGRDCVLRI